MSSNSKRQRRTRQPLPSRHPVSTPAATEPTPSVPTTPAPEAQAEAVAPPAASAPAPVQPAQEPVIEAAPAPQLPVQAVQKASTGTLPPLEVNVADPAAHMVSPTQLSIPASIVARFDQARTSASSHTALVIDALRAHADKLPALILSRRPGPKEGDLFPFRATAAAAAAETPMPLRNRPTKGELDVMKKLVDWANSCISQQRPGTKPTNRSEMVAAALDAHLPAAR
jgi:hypothetical protein